MALEGCWSSLLATQPFSLLCVYPVRSFAGENRRTAFLRACAVLDHLLSPVRDGVVVEVDARLKELASLEAVLRERISLRDVVENAVIQLRPRLDQRAEIVSITTADLAVAGEQRWLQLVVC